MAIAAARRASKKNVPQRLSIMEKKIPTNPKFAHIKSVINTGSSASNLPKPLTDQELAKRRTEMFKRIKCSRVYEMIQNMEGADDTESVYDIVAPDMTEKLDAKSIVSISQQSTGSRVSTVESGAIGLANSRDILLIDLRPADEFRKSRIPFAVNHPGHLITRDCFSPGMKNFMVKVKGRAIVVYHTDDKQSAYYATLLIQKGWEEVWIVEGGFSEFMHSYPEGVDESS